METIKTLWCWLFSQQKRMRKEIDAIENLERNARITSKCRFNASIRLQHQGNFAFFTTTVLSLGLIFIPLMQNAEVPLAFKPNVLNMMQVFLAVAVLVYSVVIGTSRYEVRAEKLNECGDKLKELIRQLNYALKEKKRLSEEDFDKYQQRYSDIVTDSENHTRCDHRLAWLEMGEDDSPTGLFRLHSYFISYAARSVAYLIPIVMILFEVIFITDMIGATSILVKYFNGNAVVSSS
ncbi:MAG: hypothetical protein A2178_01585 [Planctomycetes bacterium GWC2_49_10]|nr:MAG: hypothetical protein A2178_01585 [Planctomycetes bacterium GWC2_49_10]